MTKEKSKGNQITEGIIWQQLLFFFFPILFGTFFQQLYNAADAMIVGRFVGKEALSAVGGSTSMLTQLIVGFFVGLSSGASVIVSQYYGAKRPEMVGYAVHTALMFSILSGIVLMFVGIGLHRFCGVYGNAGRCAGAFGSISENLLCRYHCQSGL